MRVVGLGTLCRLGQCIGAFPRVPSACLAYMFSARSFVFFVCEDHKGIMVHHVRATNVLKGFEVRIDGFARCMKAGTMCRRISCTC